MRFLLTLCLLCFSVSSIANSQEAKTSLRNKLSLVPADAFAIAIVRPGRMFNVKGISDNPLADLISPLGVKPSEIEFAVASAAPSFENLAFLFFIQAKKPFNQDNVRRTLSPRSTKLEGFPYPVFDGQMNLAFPKPNQLLFSQKMGQIFDALNRLNSGGNEANSKLAKMLEADSNTHAQVVADVEKFRHYMTYSSGAYRPVPLPEISDGFLPASTKSIQAHLDINANRPLEIKVLTTKDVLQFQSTIKKRLKDFTAELKALGSDSKTAIIDDVACVDIDNGVLIEYRNSGTPGEFWNGILEDINVARMIVTNQRDQTKFKLGVSRVILAALNYESANQKFPTNFLKKDGTALLSWRVAVLPFIGERGLYKSFKLDEPWDSEHNKPLLKKMPRLFHDPFSKSARQQKTRIQCLSGKDGTFSNALTFDDVKDGTNNSIAVVVSDVAVPWTKPTDHTVDLDKPWSNLNKLPIVGMFNGLTVILKKPDQEKELRAGLTISAGDGGVEYKPTYQTSEEHAKRSKAAMLKNFGPSGISEAVAEYATQPFYARKKTSPPADAMEVATKFIQSQDPDQIAVGLLILNRLKPTVDSTLLLPLLESNFISNRQNAISLIVKTRDPKAIAAAFSSDVDMECLSRAFADEKIDADSLSGLVPLLKHKDRELRIDAGWALTVFGKQTYRSDIEKLQQDEDEEVRKSAANMTSVLDNPDE